ncbi:hypothetical protein [Bacillus salacetis]|nr:hypothetical protein [Bacillus salacetis]
MTKNVYGLFLYYPGDKVYKPSVRERLQYKDIAAKIQLIDEFNLRK